MKISVECQLYVYRELGFILIMSNYCDSIQCLRYVSQVKPTEWSKIEETKTYLYQKPLKHKYVRLKNNLVLVLKHKFLTLMAQKINSLTTLFIF